MTNTTTTRPLTIDAAILARALNDATARAARSGAPCEIAIEGVRLCRVYADGRVTWSRVGRPAAALVCQG